MIGIGDVSPVVEPGHSTGERRAFGSVAIWFSLCFLRAFVSLWFSGITTKTRRHKDRAKKKYQPQVDWGVISSGGRAGLRHPLHRAWRRRTGKCRRVGRERRDRRLPATAPG